MEKQIGVAEREPWRAQRIGQALQVDPPLLKGDDEPQPAFLVLQEEALAVAARELAAQRHRFGDSEDRRVAVRAVRDAERVEPGEQPFRGERRGGRGIRRHGGHDASRGDNAQELATPLPCYDMDRREAGVAQG